MQSSANRFLRRNVPPFGSNRPSKEQNGANGVCNIKISFIIQCHNRKDQNEKPRIGRLYHSMIKFPTNQGIMIMETSKEALWECRQLERVQDVLRENIEVFAWAASERTVIPRFIMEHQLKIYPLAEPVVHKRRPMTPNGRHALKERVFRWLKEGMIRKVQYPEWVTNTIPVKLANGTWKVKCKYVTRNTGKVCKNEENADSYEDNIMVRINIDDLTIEQYLRLTLENQTPNMVKKVDDITINEYMKYEERMKRHYSRSFGSYFPTYSSHKITIECASTTNLNAIQSNINFNYDSEDMELDEEAGYTIEEESVTSEHEVLDPAHVNNVRSFDEELSSEEDLDEWLKGEMKKHMNECRAFHKNKQKSAPEVNLKNSSKNIEDIINNDNFMRNLPNQSPLAKLNPGGFLLPFTIGNYNSYAMANINASNNVMPRNICEYLMLDNLEGASMSEEMDELTQQETLGTIKNVSVKIDKFEFPCDFVVTNMPKNLREMIILGRPFLETIHAQIDVFQEEISLGIGKDIIKFGINGNLRLSNSPIKKVYMANTSQEEESFNPLEIAQDMFSYESPACFQFKQDNINYDAIDPLNETVEQTSPLLEKGG
ncbi:reverse transcriptase domain-containing protein [Tanacetum coccineum]